MKNVYSTPELKQYVLENYDGSSEMITQIQEKFNVPRGVITSMARRLKLSKNKNFWSESDLEYLKENWGIKTVPIMSKFLKRTPYAVRRMAIKLELGTRKLNYTLDEVGRLFDIDAKAVKRWGGKGLVITKAKTDAKIYSIKVEDLIEFLKDYKGYWDSRKMQYSLWITEPEWFKQRKREDKLKPNKHYQKWDDNQDRKLVELYNKGMEYKEIGEIIGRSEVTTKQRMRDINFGRK